MELKPAIELKNITKTFGSVVANKDVNLTVNRGEILSILGENGSGKTTLMNMLSGIYYPDSGEIFIDGEKKETKKAAGYFLSCDIEKGDHKIILRYTVPGIKVGAIISLLSVMTFIALAVIEHKSVKSKRKAEE